MTETELEYQFCFNCDDRKQCYTKPKDCTRIQEEIGLQEMTNEEWFCGLSTEEKAEWLCSKEYYCEFIDGCNYCPLFEADKHRCLDLSNKELWELWLKEIHK